MRILVADQNAQLLAAITATFGRHCDLVTATGRNVCLEQAGRLKFDLVVAGDKLVDYTGLELLSEMAGLFPGTLLIFVASPARLKRLGSRLQLFGLLEVIAYPLTSRKLLEVLQRARRELPPKSGRPVRHVVLEAEWDTGERLGLLERELENATTESTSDAGWLTQDEGLIHGALDANSRPSLASSQVGFETEAALDDFVFAPPPPAVDHDCTVAIELVPSEVPVAPAADELEEDDAEPLSNDAVFDQPELPPEPVWAEDGAANDTIYEPTVARGVPNAPSNQVAARPSQLAARSGEKRPKVRTPTQPTAAQLAAFQRALARRNAGRSGLAGPADRSGANHDLRTTAESQAEALSTSPAGGASRKAGRSRSLAELARLAASKRPLMVPKLNGSRAAANRTVFMVGSGVAAVLIVGVLFFELLRTPSDAKEHLARTAVARAPFASSSAPSPVVVTNSTDEIFTPSPSPSPSSAPPPAPEQIEQPPADPDNVSPDGRSIYSNRGSEPPPPPALERPGPSEPPSTDSMELRGPPQGMVPPGFEPQPDAQ